MPRPRRSCLVVPANSPRMLAKAAELAADEVILDLEDAVPASEKTDATRSRLIEAILGSRWRARTLSVRVNAVGTPWFEDDIDQLVRHAGTAVNCIVLPKVESADDVRAAAALVGGEIVLEAQIESARGLIEVERIAGASARLDALVFGPGDFAASLGIPQLDIGGFDKRYPGDQWHYARARIAVAAHAFGLDAIDGPYSAVEDVAGLRESARRARLVGFTGKWAIHPSQIASCDEMFSPTTDEIRHAERVLATLEQAARSGYGTAALDGTMIDEASRRIAEAVLGRAYPGEGR
jgi:citrate lyase subunit beta / citryl-CoA lyase